MYIVTNNPEESYIGTIPDSQPGKGKALKFLTEVDQKISEIGVSNIEDLAWVEHAVNEVRVGYLRKARGILFFITDAQLVEQLAKSIFARLRCPFLDDESKRKDHAYSFFYPKYHKQLMDDCQAHPEAPHLTLIYDLRLKRFFTKLELDQAKIDERNRRKVYLIYEKELKRCRIVPQSLLLDENRPQRFVSSAPLVFQYLTNIPYANDQEAAEIKKAITAKGPMLKMETSF